jgi:hypothetical protein
MTVRSNAQIQHHFSLLLKFFLKPKATAKTTAKQTIGIDLGDRNSAYCVLDPEGDVLSEGTVRTSESGFAQQFQGAPTCRIAIETGTHSPWVSRLLQSSDPLSRWRAVLGTCDARCARLKRGAFPLYWPI